MAELQLQILILLHYSTHYTYVTSCTVYSNAIVQVGLRTQPETGFVMTNWAPD